MNEAQHLADSYSADALRMKIDVFEKAEALARGEDNKRAARNAANRLRVYRAALTIKLGKTKP
jgi:hypothetical protein